MVWSIKCTRVSITGGKGTMKLEITEDCDEFMNLEVRSHCQSDWRPSIQCGKTAWKRTPGPGQPLPWNTGLLLHSESQTRLQCYSSVSARQDTSHKHGGCHVFYTKRLSSWLLEELRCPSNTSHYWKWMSVWNRLFYLASRSDWTHGKMFGWLLAHQQVLSGPTHLTVQVLIYNCVMAYPEECGGSHLSIYNV